MFFIKFSPFFIKFLRTSQVFFLLIFTECHNFTEFSNSIDNFPRTSQFSRQFYQKFPIFPKIVWEFFRFSWQFSKNFTIYLTIFSDFYNFLVKFLNIYSITTLNVSFVTPSPHISQVGNCLSDKNAKQKWCLNCFAEKECESLLLLRLNSETKAYNCVSSFAAAPVQNVSIRGRNWHPTVSPTSREAFFFIPTIL